MGNKYTRVLVCTVIHILFVQMIPSEPIQKYLGDTVGLVSDHDNKVSIAIKQVMQIFWFPSAYKSYVHTIL